MKKNKATSEDLRDALRAEMTNEGLSLRDVSRALGLSTGSMSQWLNGSYKGNVAKINENVNAFLQRRMERRSAPKKQVEFVKTSAARKVLEIARICHLDGEIGVCYGPAGIGKTESVKEYARENPDVILLEVDLGHTAKVLFSELHKRLGFDGLGTVHAMFEDAVGRLRDSGRLIVIDEAEHLPYRALELLRRVYDKAGAGILLVGMPRLISNLRGKRGEYAQLYSRVGIASRLDVLRPEDSRLIIETLIPGANGLSRAFHDTAHGNTRTLCKLLARSLRLAEINGTAVTPEVVRETAKMLII